MTPVFLILLCAFLLVVAMMQLWQVQRLKDELRDMTDDRDVQAYKAKDFERATEALTQELNEATEQWRKVLADYRVCVFSLVTAEADADRLAPIVKNFIADVEAISAKLGTFDCKPPDLSEEREAIRLHEEAVKLRTK